VILCGTMANFCCGATAREAFRHGFDVAFGSDINSSDDEECQRAELKTLRRGYARVLAAAEIIEELRESVEGPHG
jgi:nicotinamidase-related amidase